MSKEVTDFSFLNGFEFEYEDGDIPIKAWFSSLSGLERTYIDNALVVSARSYKRESKNSFSFNGNNYSTRLCSESILKGPYEFTLKKNGEVLSKQKLFFSKSKTSPSKLATFLRFLGGAGLAVIYILMKAYFQWPDSTLILFVGVLLVCGILFRRSSTSSVIVEIDKNA